LQTISQLHEILAKKVKDEPPRDGRFPGQCRAGPLRTQFIFRIPSSFVPVPAWSRCDPKIAPSAPLSRGKLPSEMADTTARKQRGRPFRRGESGNPTGRPLGARHKATVAAEALLDGEAQALTRKAVEMALAGDTTAMRLCLDRILPPRRERLINLKLPPLRSPADAAAAMAAITAAVATADITRRARQPSWPS
jgi:uncharacterized protein DUF5681